VRVVAAKGHDLVFGTFLSEPEFRRAFGRLVIVQ